MAEKKKQLLRPIELAKSAYEIYKLRLWTMAGIFLISVGLAILGGIIFSVLGVIGFFATGAKFEGSTIGIIGVIGLIALIALVVFATLVQAAYLIVLRDWKDTGAKKALREARQYVLPLFLTGLLQGILIFGGYFLLFIPAFIFGIWFTFTKYIVVVEGKSGLDAIHTSREYVRGRFWGILGRMIVVYVPEWIVWTILSSIFDKSGEQQGALGILQFARLFLVPFYMMYMFRLYEDVKKTAGKVSLPVLTGNKIVYFVFPVLGYLILLAGIIGLISIAPKLIEQGSKYLNAGKMADGTNPIKPSTTIMYGIVQYYAAKGSFPIGLKDIVTAGILPSIPNEEKSGRTYQYSMEKEGKSFKLCTPKGVTPSKCVTPESSSFDL